MYKLDAKYYEKDLMSLLIGATFLVPSNVVHRNIYIYIYM